ncbi:MAG: hypothetical protein HY744_31080 [Deltaproteobacteria bacterium]|nr:hypothetical protein [Deltaproteobacteria bacterium]
MKPVVVDALVVAALLAGAAAAWAQDEAAPSAPAPEVPAAPAGQSAPGVTVVQVPGYAPPAQPPAPDVNAGHLPSSARASGDTSRSSDGFDLGSPNASAATVHGGD